jgi:hypothetical protein
MSCDPVGLTKGGNGGNVIFMPGKGFKECLVPGIDGDMIFMLADDTEFMRLRHDGKAIVRGEEVVGNQDVYNAFAYWVQTAVLHCPDPVIVDKP